MVTFPFRIGKAFLDYHWHPITIPKACYPQLELEGLADKSVTVVSPFGSTLGSVVHSQGGYGPYYQIKMAGGQGRDPMAQFKFEQRVTVAWRTSEKQSVLHYKQSNQLAPYRTSC